VCCLFYFLLHITFFKEKVKSGRVGLFLGFIVVFFMWAFKNNGLFVLVQSNYFNTEDNYERLIDFLTVLNYGSKP